MVGWGCSEQCKDAQGQAAMLGAGWGSSGWVGGALGRLGVPRAGWGCPGQVGGAQGTLGVPRAGWGYSEQCRDAQGTSALLPGDGSPGAPCLAGVSWHGGPPSPALCRRPCQGVLPPREVAAVGDWPCRAVAVAVPALTAGPGVRLMPPRSGIILLNPPERHRGMRLEPPSRSPVSPGEGSGAGEEGRPPSHHPAGREAPAPPAPLLPAPRALGAGGGSGCTPGEACAGQRALGAELDEPGWRAKPPVPWGRRAGGQEVAVPPASCPPGQPGRQQKPRCRGPGCSRPPEPTAAARGRETRAGPGGELAVGAGVVLGAGLPRSPVLPSTPSQRSPRGGGKGFCLGRVTPAAGPQHPAQKHRAGD